MRFSERTAWELGENEFAARLAVLRRAGGSVLDLTVSNPTACGFVYAEEALLAPLCEPGAWLYEPEPLGIELARAAVARYYKDAGAVVPVERICLTTSTSEAYSFLFRLLCDPGDEVLVASPSYPLFDYIARLDGVRLVEYPLQYHDGWQIDVEALKAAVTERTRAVIVVHPNNPTGQFCSAAERRALEAVCAGRGLALIVDEVFLDYALAGVARQSFAVGASGVLTFVLSGISKVCGLPQMKCSWIAACGPERMVAAAMQRMEIVADTFLSMNAPVQHALGDWLAGRQGFQQQVRERVRVNLEALDAALAGTVCQRFAMEAGWTAVLRVPRTVRGVEFSLAALEAGVVVQPGAFYGMGEGRVVVSLLTPVEVWREGVARLVEVGQGERGSIEV
jgi:alanine-synthesizing transaminase